MVSLVKRVGKLITYAVSSIVTLLASKLYSRTLSVVSSSLVTLTRFRLKVLTISVNCGIILSKLINKQLTIITTVLSTLIVSVISFINFAKNKVMYARNSIRDQAKIRFDTIIEASSKLKQVTSVKFRTLFINKDSKI